jgi:hypothetical protein
MVDGRGYVVSEIQTRVANNIIVVVIIIIILIPARTAVCPLLLSAFRVIIMYVDQTLVLTRTGYLYITRIVRRSAAAP